MTHKSVAAEVASALCCTYIKVHVRQLVHTIPCSGGSLPVYNHHSAVQLAGIAPLRPASAAEKIFVLHSCAAANAVPLLQLYCIKRKQYSNMLCQSVCRSLIQQESYMKAYTRTLHMYKHLHVHVL
jgi:hypothetical protein